MLRASLARRSCAPAVGSLVLSTVLAAGLVTFCEQSIVDLPQGAIEDAVAAAASLPVPGPAAAQEDGG